MWKTGFQGINHLKFHGMITPRSLSLSDSCLDPSKPKFSHDSAISCLRSCLCRDIPCHPSSGISCHDMTYLLSLSLSLSLWGLYICTSPPTWWTIHHSTIIEIKWLNLISNLSMLLKPQRCFTVILKGYFIQISNHMILKWETNYFL